MKLFYQSHYGFQFEYRVNQLDYPPHIHNAVELVFLSKGRSTVQCGSERLELCEGDIFAAFPNQVHSYENSRDVECYLLILPVKPCLAPYAATLTKQVPDSACVRRGGWEHTGLMQLVELAFRDMDTASETVMQGYMQVIFGKLLPLLCLHSLDGGSDEALHSVLEYLRDHYHEPLTRASIAKAVGYNESYISHMFSKNLNTTLPEYINALRIYDASVLLTQTDDTITQIVAELGFGSIRNFNRVFQKEIGMSPREYRARGGRR